MTTVVSSASNSIRGCETENMSSHYKKKQSIYPTFASVNAKNLKKKKSASAPVHQHWVLDTYISFPLGEKPAMVEKLHNSSKVKTKSSVKIWIHQGSYNCCPVMGLGRGCRLRSLGRENLSPVSHLWNPGQNNVTKKVCRTQRQGSIFQTLH